MGYVQEAQKNHVKKKEEEGTPPSINPKPLFVCRGNVKIFQKFEGAHDFGFPYFTANSMTLLIGLIH